jgi:hypothetical protein
MGFRCLPRRGHGKGCGYNFLCRRGIDFAVARRLQAHLVVDTELRKMHNALDVELSIRRIREAM